MAHQSEISRRIKETRLRLGLSQAQLAYPELSDSYVSLIESGNRIPTANALKIIAAKLNCSVDYLVYGVGSEQINRIERALDKARGLLEGGARDQARRLYREIFAEPELRVLPKYYQQTAYGLALATEACGELDEATRILVELRETNRDSMSDELRIGSALALSRCYRDQGRFDLAIEVAEGEVAAMAEKGWTDHLVELASTLLSSYYTRGDLLRAEQYAAELLSTADALGTPRAIIAANWNAAQLAHMAGRDDEALARMEKAWAQRPRYGDVRNRARLLVAYADLRLELRPGEAAECRDLLLQGERELRESSASSLDLAECLQLLAVAEMTLGHADEALRYAREALAENADRSAELTAVLRMLMGRAYLALNQRDEAIAAVESAMSVLADQPPTKKTAETWLKAAAVLQELGDYEGSRVAYQRAMECGGV